MATKKWIRTKMIKKRVEKKQKLKRSREIRDKIKCTIPGVNALWIMLFNDVASGKSGRDWTDDEISQKMHEAFPDRQSAIFDNVPAARSRYNRGKLNGQKRVPRKRIPRIY